MVSLRLFSMLWLIVISCFSSCIINIPSVFFFSLQSLLSFFAFAFAVHTHSFIDRIITIIRMLFCFSGAAAATAFFVCSMLQCCVCVAYLLVTDSQTYCICNARLFFTIRYNCCVSVIFVGCLLFFDFLFLLFFFVGFAITHRQLLMSTIFKYKWKLFLLFFLLRLYIFKSFAEYVRKSQIPWAFSHLALVFVSIHCMVH